MPITEATSPRRTAKADAMEFLSRALAGDPVPATEVRRRGEITESSNGWGGRHRHEKWGFTGLRMKSITAT